MRITYLGGWDIRTRWRWDANGQFGYAATLRGAANAARKVMQ